MDGFHESGLILIMVGILIVVVGGIVYLAGGTLSWIGRLPGDIRIERENSTFYFPLTTMILISIVINIIIRIIRYIF